MILINKVLHICIDITIAKDKLASGDLTVNIVLTLLH